MIRLSCIILLAFALNNSVWADERILSFKSDVVVQENGSLRVVESITVQAEGKNIKRGVYRDLPNSYPHPQYGNYGFKSKTPIDIKSLTRNGTTESWHTESFSNGIRVFFGRASRSIKPGVHTYKLRYTIDRQIAQDQDKAIFYWNVTGNGWQFPIDTAGMNVIFPAASPAISKQAWTGRQGSTASNAKFRTLANGSIAITTTKGLAAYEGLTVKLTFDSDSLTLLVESDWEKLYRDNKGYAWGIALLLAMLVLYTIMWWLKGRDPDLGIVVARYRPLVDLSAAAHRAIYRNRADDTSFAVGILSAAVKGHLQIHKKDESIFELEANGDGDLSNLAPSELLIVNRLFSKSKSVTLGRKYSSIIEDLKKDYEKLLKGKYAKPAHVNHFPMLLLGLLIGAIGLALIFSASGVELVKHFFSAVIVGAIVLILGPQLFKKVHFSGVYLVAASSLLFGVFTLYQEQLQFAIPLIFFGSVLGAATYLLPAPKPKGQKLINKIEGFRLYLSMAEHESLKRLNLPEKTPQLYEELLPFAIALDLETQWSDQFTTVLANAAKDGDRNNYHSSWYRGSGHFDGASSFAPALAAGLASSVVAASTPPSNSGSGGGGFSGGGGGGGGGGGW